MKRIVKLSEPQTFSAWKTKFQAEKGRMPTYMDLVGKEKQDLKETLLDEQGYICCYCMKRIETYNSHIEHFRPKSNPKYSALDLDYNNMFASCNGAKENGENCGHRKDAWFDENTTVCPLEEDVEELFTYLPNGEIIAANGNPGAAETIDRFGLDTKLLTNHRYAAIRAAINQGALKDVDDWLSFFEEKDADGCYQPFCQAVVCVLRSLA